MKIRTLPCIRSFRKWPLALLLLASAMVSVPVHAETVLLMRATCGGSLLTAGEGIREGFEDYVDLSSIHHDLSAPLRSGPGGTVSPAPLAIEPIRIVKSTSASSIGMISVMAQGQFCTEILLENRQFGGTAQSLPVWRLELQQAYIVARKEWQTAEDPPLGIPQESFELFPTRVGWTHFSVDAQGGVTPIEFNWDFETNSVP